MQFLSHSFAVGLEYDSMFTVHIYKQFFVIIIIIIGDKKSDRRTKEQSIQNWKENTTPLADVNTENDIRDKYRERERENNKKVYILYAEIDCSHNNDTHSRLNASTHMQQYAVHRHDRKRIYL